MVWGDFRWSSMRFSKQIKVHFHGMLVFLVRLCRELSLDFYDLFYIGKGLFFGKKSRSIFPVMLRVSVGFFPLEWKPRVPIRVDDFLSVNFSHFRAPKLAAVFLKGISEHQQIRRISCWKWWKVSWLKPLENDIFTIALFWSNYSDLTSPQKVGKESKSPYFREI